MFSRASAPGALMSHRRFSSLSLSSSVLLVAALASVALGAGCPPPPELPPPPAPPSECQLDPNFDTTATDVASADGTSGVLCPAFDQDFWAVDVAEAGTILQITLSMPVGTISVVNPAYRIIQDNGTPDGTPTPFAAEDPARVNNSDPTQFTAAHRIEVPGRYFVVVSDARFVEDAFDIDNAYTLQVAQLSDPDENEPNNNEDAATPLVAGSVGVPFTGQVATTGDEDWFAIDVPSGAQLADVTVTGDVAAGVDLTVTLFEDDGLTEVAAAALRAVEDVDGEPTDVLQARLRTRVNGGERVYLVVRDDDGTDSQLAATGVYTVTLAIIANPDDNEGDLGNDDAATATPTTSGSELSASLATLADQDLYRITPPASTSRENPGVLIVTIETDGTIDKRTFRPQVIIVGADPEDDSAPCVATCTICDEALCKEPRLQRFVDANTFRTAYPLRDDRAVYVLVNEAGDDAFQERGGYRVRLEIVDDRDPGEVGDDFLIPNLEFAGFANNDDLREQYRNSIERARVLATDYPPVCDDAGEPLGCLPIVDVPEPIDGVAQELTKALDCGAPGLEPRTLTATGRLSYEGDRDYFRIDLPPRNYYALNFRYSATGVDNTPIELALFVHNGAGQVIGNTLEAEQTAGFCRDSTECPAASICVDEACWAETDSNPDFTSHLFPDPDPDPTRQDDAECSFVGNIDEPPYFLEVVDNGINDFDTELTYTFTLDVLCGCPAVCNVGDGLTTRCQGVVDPT